MKVSRPLLRWHGGKWMLAPWTIGHFPEHRTYTEVFGGGGSVLLRKPRSYSEVYNDLDGDVVNLFRVLRAPHLADSLISAIRLTPFAKEEFNGASVHTDEPVERARRLVIRSLMGFGSNAHNIAIKTGFRSNSSRSGTTPAHDWANYPDKLAAIVHRLRGVCVENRDAAEVLAQHDGPSTLHYVDPPYPHETRADGRGDYAFETTTEGHRNLAAVLHGLLGTVILSGYPCDLYDKDLYADWHRVERVALADGAKKRIEVLWMNRADLDGGRLL